MEGKEAHPHHGKPIKGVIFDMDGTLTVQGLIDFKRIRERLNLTPEQDLIEALNACEKARAVVEEEEKLAFAALKLQPGFEELMKYLRENHIRSAIVTRNSQASVEIFLKTCEHTQHSFEMILTRDFEKGFKPNPAPLLHICEKWGLDVENVIMTGDGRDDIEAGTRAGCRTVLMHDHTNDSYLHLATYAVRGLDGLIPLLDSCNKNAKPQEQDQKEDQADQEQ